MNWLAHILLSKKSVDYQLGNLLADPLKGKAWAGCNAHVEDGLKMHCSIDTFTDANQHVRKSKSRLGKSGHLKGVVIDIAYDYLLLKNWEKYVEIDFDSFINKFYLDSRKEIEHYPQKAKDFVERLIVSNLLPSYASFEGLEIAFSRVDKRLSERILAKESTTSYVNVLRSEISGIERDFELFFPQLITHFKSRSNLSSEEYWLK